MSAFTSFANQAAPEDTWLVDNLKASIEYTRNRYATLTPGEYVVSPGSFGLFQQQMETFVEAINESVKTIQGGFTLLKDTFALDEPAGYKKPNKQYYLQYNSRMNGKSHDRARASNSDIRSNPGLSRKHSRHRAHPRRG